MVNHIPFRSWCELCVKNKSKQDHSTRKTLTERNPIIQIDYNFMTSKVQPLSGDGSTPPSVTLLTAVDVLTGLGLCIVVPKKGRCPYAKAELLRFLRSIGRTFGTLQSDLASSLVTLCNNVCDEMPTVTLRTRLVNWKHNQLKTQ